MPDWYFEHDLGGGITTPTKSPADHQRHQERLKYLFGPLNTVCGGDLKGRQVLDVGCNSGFFSLAALECGANSVVGVDADKTRIDQCRFLMEALEVDANRHQFTCGDFFTFLGEEHRDKKFDVVLCLGVLHRVGCASFFPLLEEVARRGTDLLVFDVAVSNQYGPVLELHREREDQPNYLNDNRLHEKRYLVIRPSLVGLQQCLKNLGYDSVILPPTFSKSNLFADYLAGGRRGVIASRRTDLSVIAGESANRRVLGGIPAGVLARSLVYRMLKRAAPGLAGRLFGS